MLGLNSTPGSPVTRRRSHGIHLSLVQPPPSPGQSVIVSAPGTPIPNDSTHQTSLNGCLTVHGYEPKHAVVDVAELLTVNLTYSDVISDASLIQLRLYVGDQYIPTSVRPGPKLTLQMNAVIPASAYVRAGERLPLSVHAYRNDKMFDSCDFGSLEVLEDGMQCCCYVNTLL